MDSRQWKVETFERVGGFGQADGIRIGGAEAWRIPDLGMRHSVAQFAERGKKHRATQMCVEGKKLRKKDSQGNENKGVKNR